MVSPVGFRVLVYLTAMFTRASPVDDRTSAFCDFLRLLWCQPLLNYMDKKTLRRWERVRSRLEKDPLSVKLKEEEKMVELI